MPEFTTFPLIDLKTWVLSSVWAAFRPGEQHEEKSKGRKMQEQLCSVAGIQNLYMGQQGPYGKKYSVVTSWGALNFGLSYMYLLY